MDLADLPASPDRSGRYRMLGLGGPLAAALALWTYAVVRTDPADLGDFGLAGALPLAFWLGLAVLAAGFWLCVRDPLRPHRWPLAYTLGLLLMERATQALVYPTPLYAWAWKHDAVIDHLLTAGALERGAALGDMAVYDQWPGFFAAQAAFVELTGLEQATAYMAWWPLLSSLLLLAPLLLIYRTFTQDRRLIWTAVWIFYAANWVGQDYFSPQSLALFLCLSVLAVVLRRGVRPPAGGRRRALLWTALLVPLTSALVTAHQLTPVMLAAGLGALCLTRRYRDWAAPAVLLLVFLAWNLTVSLPFLREAVPEMVRSFGDVAGNLEAGYGTTPTGTGPVLVSWVSRALSASVLLLAAYGAWRRPLLRRRATGLLLLATVPLLMLAANDYGSEMIFRVLLFMLPGASFFAAAALLPDARTPATAPDGRGRPLPVKGWRFGVLPAVALLALTAAFVPSYAGKDQLSYFPEQEVALVRQLVDGAPDGSLVVAANRNYPLAYDTYWRIDHYWFLDDGRSHVEAVLNDPAATLARDMSAVEPPARGYLLLTRGQIAYSDGNGMLTAAELHRIETSVAASPLFERVAQNSAGAVYELRRTS
ncbi:glycosyltransferase [Streptomyces sp. MUM 178J]|uniref:glycosyltransferase n=1 Tax=Streptomyces sp. MUM 178J TaxID=2791991 RepID=UPI001F04B316|nr:glycosyltransferase [Streptomyces sp. MUM 178J]WRQ79734.1 glycosyltransferase [Streptomyces sp. MUM 178J]